MKITIELPDDLHKALKSDFAAQVISEKFLGLELSASTKVAHLVLQAAQQGAHWAASAVCNCATFAVYGEHHEDCNVSIAARNA